jgi:predicted DNA binding CopG/RHH family protein
VERKSDRLQLRIAPHDRAAVKTTASNLGVSLSKFVRTAVLEGSALEVARQRCRRVG